MKKIVFCIVLLCAGMQTFAQHADLFWKNGNESEITGISISPDDKYFVSVEKDMKAVVWEVASGQQLRTITNVEAAAFRDNNSINLVMDDKTFKVVDLTGQTINRYTARPTNYDKLHHFYLDISREFYPESSLYFFGNTIFDMDKGKLRNINFDGSRVYCPATKMFAFSSSKTNKVSLVSSETGGLVREFTVANPDQKNIHAAFSDDGQKIMIYCGSTIQLRATASGNLIRTINAGTWRVDQATFSPDGKRAVVMYYGETGKVSVIDLGTGAKIWEKAFPDGFGCEVKFSPDGNKLMVWMTYSIDYEIFSLINAATGKTISTFKHESIAPATYGQRIEFSPDGKKVLIGNYRALFWMDTESGAVEKSFKQIFQGYVSKFLFTKDNSRMFSFANNYIFGWNTQTGAMDKIVPAKDKDNAGQENEYVPAVDGKRFFVLRNNHLREIDTAGKLIFQYTTATKKLDYRHGIDLSYDGKFVKNQGTNETIPCKGGGAEVLEVFDTKLHTRVLFKPCIATERVAFAHTKNVVVLQEAYGSGILKFYDLPSGKLINQIKVPNMASNAEGLMFSPSDRYLVVMGERKDEKSATTTIVIDLKTNQINAVPVELPGSILKRLDTYAMVRPVSFMPDEKHLVFYSFRTENVFFLDLEKQQFDEDMTILNPIDRMASSLGISPNGQFLLIGTYKGTIVLWNIEQKKAVATLYPEPARRNWAVVLPDGSFDANSGAQATMFHTTGNTLAPLSAVFEQFYMPRLFARAIAGEKFEPVNVDVNKLKKAPVVRIQFKENNRNLEVADDVAETIQTKVGNASITVTAECPLDGVTEMRLYQNGKLVQSTRNLEVGDDDIKGEKSVTKTFQLSLLEGSNRFRAIALNTQRTESKPVELNVIYKPEDVGPAIAKTLPGIQLHVVVVGINLYKNSKYNLNYAQADAEAFKTAVSAGTSGIFSKVNMHYVQDAAASKAGIVGALEQVKADAGSQDVFVFYYAGHGVMNDKKEFYLVPSDVTQLYGNDDALAQKGLSATSLQQFSKDIKAQKQLFILDACQSAGALDNIVALRGAAEEKAIAQMARSTGTHWLTASGSNQFASEFTQLGHGAFTWCLLEAFKGGADNGDKKLTVKELDAYLQSKVPEITQKYRGTAQYPASYGYGNDFPFMMVK